jgi:hypothetical protein
MNYIQLSKGDHHLRLNLIQLVGEWDISIQYRIRILKLFWEDSRKYEAKKRRTQDIKGLKIY